MKNKSIINKALNITFGTIAASVIIFEEVIYNSSKNAINSILSKIPTQKIEEKIKNLSPNASLAAFLIPVIALFPIKLIGLKFIAAGHAITGSSVFLGGKIAGYSITSKIYELTKDNIRSIPKYAKIHDSVFEYKDKIINWSNNQPIVKFTKEKVILFKENLKDIIIKYKQNNQNQDSIITKISKRITLFRTLRNKNINLPTNYFNQCNLKTQAGYISLNTNQINLPIDQSSKHQNFQHLIIYHINNLIYKPINNKKFKI